MATTTTTIRLEEEQLEQFKRRAKAEGKSVSEWLRDMGAAAINPPTNVLRGPEHYHETHKEAPTSRAIEAAEHAETGIGRSVAEFLKASMSPVADIEFPAGAPEEPVRSWREIWDRTSKRGEAGEAEWADALNGVRIPADRKTPQSKIAWLDAEHPLEGK